MTAALVRRLDDAAATEAAGARLARLLAARPGLVVFLHGDLGAGKTTLVRGWLRALGVTGPIRSPTYTLVEPYELDGRSLLHLDLYRLSAAAELEQLGVYDTPPESSVWLVEWPERGDGELPPPDLSIFLQVSGTGREIRLEPSAALGPLLVNF
ncbi:MAG TPA: tRNA (adenosine(37)-N6)-threonylcarbamoyltransferase complex ATPase subunit type 1 TsaE [Nevskia sp.]|nr:tRNA (adenosine(37)-N6)-threonylcarbamoyltransferase complex ATPase subunit type 1 TsaE [Nevskia sp.]